MKKILTLAIIFLLSGNFYAQKISVKQRNETIGNGNNPALVATIFEADVSTIEKEWKSLMKSHDAKMTMGGEILADNARFKEFENTCDVYCRIKNVSDTEKELMVAVDMGGAFLSGKHPAQQKKIENMMYDFAVRLTKDAIAVQVKEAEKIQKRMIKDQENLEDDKKQMLKDIENYKTKIADRENSIIENTKFQETKKAEIASQNKLVETIKGKLNSVK